MIRKIIILVLIFILGIFTALFYLEVFSERISPDNRIRDNQIEIDSERVIINVEGARLVNYADTNSMDPIIDKNVTGIEIKPRSEEDIKIGDIIAYKSQEGLISHRVIKKGVDEKGTYFILKGDNNTFTDPNKVRFDDVEYVLAGILY